MAGKKKELRVHQVRAQQIADEIVDKGGEWPHKITSAYVTPGAGKTLLASVFAHQLVKGDVIDHVLYVCPRKSLRSQVVKGFKAPEFDLNGTLVSLTGPPTGQTKLYPDMGYVTTYQSVSDHGVLGPEEQANMRRFEKEYPDQFRLLPFEHSLALTRGLWPIAKREAK